ncbi:MAG: GTP pyrophosphokinase family protein [Lachnospiraceae bacterium]|nr:GTP pyrophosphokinase family protein [Lachnospiraceae bacterium]
MAQTKEENPEVESWEEVILIYNSALKEMNTKLEILNEEFKHVHSYNPIEHISSRLKSSEGIVKKLKKHEREVNIENMVKYVNDIAGVRIICSFTSAIYNIADMITNQSDLTILSVKDYVQQPKDSGYQSYHMIIGVPVYLSDRIVEAKVELQIRTVAMDFWASLEHKINYKFEGKVPDYIRADLVENAFMIRELDSRMEKLNDEVNKINIE